MKQILCNIGGDPSLEPTGGGYVLAVIVSIIVGVWLFSRRDK